MKKYLQIILVVAISVLAVYLIAHATTNVFPTTLNDWDDGDIIESGWADSIEAKIGVTGSLVTSSLDYQMSHLASLSRADTITANWVNTASPWADNEVADNITIDLATSASDLTCTDCINATEIENIYLLLTGGTLTGNLIGTGASFSSGEFTSYASVSNTFTAGKDDSGEKWSAFGATYATRFNASTLVQFSDEGGLNSDWVFNVAGGGIPVINMLSSDGTLSSRSFSGIGQDVSYYDSYGWKSGNWQQLSRIYTEVATDTGSDLGGNFFIQVADGNGSLDDVLTFLSTANSSVVNVGINNTSPTTTLDISGSASVSSNFEVGGYASIGGNIFIGSGRSVVGAGTLTIGDNNNSLIISATNWDVDTNGNVQFGNGSQTSLTESYLVSGADPILTYSSNLVDITGGVSLSLNFEADGYASASQYFGGNASHQFSGSLSGRTTGTLSVGTSNNPLKILWSNIIKAVTQFFFPTTTSTVPATAGEAIVNTASGSLEVYTGSANKILDGVICKTWAYEDPTSPNEWGRVFFRDPFTITDVTVTTSGSNSAGWNMAHGLTGAITTDLFTSNHSASTSITYTTFADATLTDREYLMFKVTSASSKIENIEVTACGIKNH